MFNIIYLAIAVAVVGASTAEPIMETLQEKTGLRGLKKRCNCDSLSAIKYTDFNSFKIIISDYHDGGEKGLLYFPFAPLHLSNSKFPDKQAENAVLKLITEDKIKPPSGAFALTTMAPNADQPVWCRPQGRCAIVWQQAMLRVDFQWSCPWWCSREGFHINFPRKKLDSEEPLGKYFSCYVNHKGDEEPCDNAVDWSDIQYW